MIIRQDELNSLCEKIVRNGRFSLDLEFIPERSYAPLICLVQVSIEETPYLIDPFSVKDLLPLWKLVADPSVLVVLHAGNQDLDLIFTESGLVPQNLFDVQIGAGFAGFGYPQGLSKLLHQVLGVTISKSETFTDWQSRPLSDSQIDYAEDDVRHIFPLYDQLIDKLNSLGRLSWAQEECATFCTIDRYQKDSAMDFLKVKGASALNRKGLAVLRSLCLSRDEEAQKSNRPIRSILSDNAILEVARRAPKSIADLERIRGVRPDQVRQFGKQMIEAVVQTLSLKESDYPSWPAGKAPPKNELLVADLLFALLKVIAYDYNLAPELIATRDELQTLVRLAIEAEKEQREPDQLKSDLLSGWRFELAGKTLTKLLKDSSLLVDCRPTKDPPITFQILPRS